MATDTDAGCAPMPPEGSRGRATMTAMPALDDLWDFDDPAASDARFRAAIEAAEAGGDTVRPTRRAPSWRGRSGSRTGSTRATRSSTGSISTTPPRTASVSGPAWSEAGCCARAAIPPPQ